MHTYIASFLFHSSISSQFQSQSVVFLLFPRPCLLTGLPGWLNKPTVTAHHTRTFSSLSCFTPFCLGHEFLSISHLSSHTSRLSTVSLSSIYCFCTIPNHCTSSPYATLVVFLSSPFVFATTLFPLSGQFAILSSSNSRLLLSLYVCVASLPTPHIPALVPSVHPCHPLVASQCSSTLVFSIEVLFIPL